MTATTQDLPARTPKRAAASSFIGSALEYYDFVIYGQAAALVFPTVFFPSANTASATMLSLATFGVAYVARPIGAVVLGHFGDRVGRRKLLVFTLLLMGFSTFAIGCLPSYSAVGVVAPVLLVIMRLLQGFSAAGEQSGAVSLTLEHSPERRRGFFTSFTLTGTQAGTALGTLVFIPMYALPSEQLYSWGWRVPFFISVVVVLVALKIRSSMPEAPEFTEAKRRGEVVKVPLVELLRTHAVDVVRVALCALIASISTLVSVYALSFATTPLEKGGHVGIDKPVMLWAAVVANLVALGTQPLWAILSDRIGRKPVFVIGALSSAAMLFVYLSAISSGSVIAIFAAAIGLQAFAYGAANAVWPAFYSEMFDTKVRTSGVALGTQIGFVAAGFAPTIATGLTTAGAYGWLPVAWVALGVAVVVALAALTARETFRIPTAQLGKRRAESPSRQPVAA